MNKYAVLLIAPLFALSNLGCGLAGGEVEQTPVPFSIGGMRIGDPLTEAFRYSHCPAKDAGKADTIGTQVLKLGGGDLYIAYEFKNNKLFGVTLMYPPTLFQLLVQSYADKFGPPHSARSETLTTRMGVEYENEIAVWKTDQGDFELRKYFTSIDEGFGMLLTPDGATEAENRKNAELEELKEKL